MVAKLFSWLLGTVAVVVIGAALLDDQALDPAVKRTVRDIVSALGSDVEDAVASPDSDKGDAPRGGGNVVDPPRAYALDYGPGWSEDPAVRVSGVDGIERTSLVNGTVRVSLTTTTQWASDPHRCLEETRSGISAWTSSTAQHDEGARVQLLDLGYPEAAAVFIYTDWADQTRRRVLVNCIDLPDGVMLAVLYDAPAVRYDDQLDERATLLADLDLA